MDVNSNFYNETIKEFQDITKSSLYFLQEDETFCDGIKNNLKKFYDFTKSNEIKEIKTALRELNIKKFNVEQIWQQVELQNDSLITQLVTSVSKLMVKNLGQFSPSTVKQVEEINEGSDNDSAVNEENINDSGSNVSEEQLPSDDGTDNDDSGTDNDGGTDNDDANDKSTSADKFFNMDEMEKFLQAEEKKTHNTEESDSEASIDLFQEAPSDDENGNSKGIKYKDFFSSQELKEKNLNKKIKEIEDDAMEEKPWQLKGEITAENRPQNSLLEQVVEFDFTTRPAPVITEQTSMQLEDIIKQRIKDSNFDSVERKVKFVENSLEYKKKLVLQQEKSKESLAQIYERDFLSQQEKLSGETKEEEESELHKEINSLMKSLFGKLDSLSNFHFTPKHATADVKIISNLPAITMEEVAPVAASDAGLLAPEEIKRRPKGDIISKNERTAADKKRALRKKKLKQKLNAKNNANKEQISKNNLNSLNKKEKNGKLSQKKIKNKNIEKISGTSEDVTKSSKKFFMQLQEEVHSQIKRKSQDSSKKETNHLRAKKLKL